jgi:hypothetical protein
MVLTAPKIFKKLKKFLLLKAMVDMVRLNMKLLLWSEGS